MPRGASSAWKPLLAVLPALPAAAGALAAEAAAADFPVRPIRLIVPFPPGGGTDILARTFGQKLTERWGQQVVVDNRPGAGGTLGAELMVKSVADGHTILMVSASYSVNPSLYRMPYDAVRDVAPVSVVATVPFILVAHPSLPASTPQELIALAKSRPGKLNYASSGNGSSPHLAGELLRMMTGIDIVHIPYKGGTPGVTDLLAGQVQLMFNTVLSALPHVKGGKLKAIALGSPKRSAAAPEIPTLHESGVPGYDVTNWFGVLAPAATPKPVVAKLNGELARIVRVPDVRERLSSEGADAVGGSPEEFAKLLRADIDKYAKIVKAAGIRLN